MEEVTNILPTSNIFALIAMIGLAYVAIKVLSGILRVVLTIAVAGAAAYFVFKIFFGA